METTERVEATAEEPLPNGGAYAILFYQDEDGTPVPKQAALRAEAIEYTAEGKPISVTILDFTGADDD